MADDPQNQDAESIKVELDSLAASVQSLNKRFRSLQEKVGVAEDLCQRFERIKSILDDPENGLEAKFTFSSQQKEKIDSIKGEADQKLVEVQNTLDQANVKVGELTAFYDQTFTPIRDKIQNGETGLEAQFTAAKVQRDEMDRLKDEAEELLGTIQTNLDGVKTHVDEMNKFFDEEFTPLKDRVLHEDDGIEATLIKVDDIKTKILTAQKSANNTLLEIQQFKEKSKTLHDESKHDRDAIQTMKDESESLKKSIGETLELVTDSSLNNAFLERKKELQKEVAIWRVVMISSLVFLFGVLSFIYYLQYSGQHILEPVEQLIRYLYTAPILILIYEAIKNYGNARDYLEKYSFKAVMSTTLSSYIKLLREQFKNVDEDVMQQFAIRKIDAIFKEPYGDHSRKKRFSFKPQDGVLDFEDSEEMVFPPNLVNPDQGKKRSLKEKSSKGKETVEVVE